MEGLFLLLIGAALFSQSWYILGLYSEGRTMGILVGGLGILALGAVFIQPVLLNGTGTGIVSPEENLAELTVMKALIVTWGLYAIAVAAHGLWDFDERAIGFYSAFLAVATAMSFIYYANPRIGSLADQYNESVWLSLSGATLVLTVLAGMMFFTLGFRFQGLRAVAGWFALLGGAVVAFIGQAIVITMISGPPGV